MAPIQTHLVLCQKHVIFSLKWHTFTHWISAELVKLHDPYPHTTSPLHLKLFIFWLSRKNGIIAFDDLYLEHQCFCLGTRKYKLGGNNSFDVVVSVTILHIKSSPGETHLDSDKKEWPSVFLQYEVNGRKTQSAKLSFWSAEEKHKSDNFPSYQLQNLNSNVENTFSI